MWYMFNSLSTSFRKALLPDMVAMSVILAVGRLNPEDCELEASLVTKAKIKTKGVAHLVFSLQTSQISPDTTLLNPSEPLLSLRHTSSSPSKCWCPGMMSAW
jgi:hypothetical protein